MLPVMMPYLPAGHGESMPDGAELAFLHWLAVSSEHASTTFRAEST